MRRDNNLLMKDYKYKGYFKGVEVFNNVNDSNLNTLAKVDRFVLAFIYYNLRKYVT
ncbi:hypothetical protein JMW52_04900 [Clostridioides difficile]|uniref:hypothetical protein n=1 Tax=Clostridioides difficile TaxID=1496 RepID=UPI001AF4FF19|nr:hypothetical protein [Clostridioides difficile]QQY54139.1 hypothetical protein JMW52_04900 [Clostridioides difficile]